MNMNSDNSHCGRTRNSIGRWLINRKLRKLKLDQAQKEQLDTVFELASSANKDHQLFKNELQERFTTMMTEQGYDHDKAVELIHTAADQHAERAAQIAGAFGDLYETLEPWQRQQALAMWKKRRHCRSHRCH